MQHFDDANFEQAHTNSPPPPKLEPGSATGLGRSAPGTTGRGRSLRHPLGLRPRPVVDRVRQAPSTTGHGRSAPDSVHDRGRGRSLGYPLGLRPRPVVDGASGTLWGSVHDRSWTEPRALRPRPVVDGAPRTQSTTGRGRSGRGSVHDLCKIQKNF